MNSYTVNEHFFNEYDCVERALLFWDRHVWIEVKLLDKNKYRIKSIQTPFKFKCFHRTTFSILLFSTFPSFLRLVKHWQNNFVLRVGMWNANAKSWHIWTCTEHGLQKPYHWSFIFVLFNHFLLFHHLLPVYIIVHYFKSEIKGRKKK